MIRKGFVGTFSRRRKNDIKTEQVMGVTQVRTINRTGDAFIDSCFHFDIVEQEDKRDIIENPDFAALIKKGNEFIGSDDPNIGNEAITLARTLREQYPDYHFCYVWLGTLYLRQGSYREARKAVDDGLRLARSKYQLCAINGEIHLKVGELEEAVKWWIRSLVIETSRKQYTMSSTLLYLSYVAESLGLDDERRALRNEVDRVNSLGIRLAANVVKNLYTLSRSASKSLIRAIVLFVREYIVFEVRLRTEELRRAAPKGIYCKACRTRYAVEQIKWYEIGSSSIYFSCPTCQCNLAYYPADDTGG